MPKHPNEKPTPVLSMKEIHLKKSYVRYLFNLTTFGFSTEKLTSLPMGKTRELYKCARYLTTQGYTTDALFDITKLENNPISLFKLVRIHKILTILNLNDIIHFCFPLVNIIFNAGESRNQLNNYLSLIQQHANTAVAIKPTKSLTTIINDLLQLLGQQPTFNPQQESKFLLNLNTHGLGLPLALSTVIEFDFAAIPVSFFNFKKPESRAPSNLSILKR